MPNINYRQSTQSGPADTTNLGYRMPGSQSNGVTWDSDWQKAPAPNFGASTGFGATSGANAGTGFTIPGLVGKQMSEWGRARGANEGRYNSAAGYLKQFSNPFSPETIARIKSANNMFTQGAANNAYREQAGLLNQNGQADASSLAAASAEANRHALGAAVNANSKLDTDAALANNQAGINIGTTLLNTLPQDRSDDYSGLMSLQNMLSRQSQADQYAQNIADRPISPGMTNSRASLGGRGPQQDSGFGFNLGAQPPMRPQSSNPPSGVMPWREREEDAGKKVGGAWF